MKRAALPAALLAFLLLDWLALDDITTGNQPSFFWEYSMIIASIVVFGVIGFFYFKTSGNLHN